MGLATACRPWRGESVRTADREQNCRAGASPADLWNSKRERLPYKSVIRLKKPWLCAYCPRLAGGTIPFMRRYSTICP